MIEEKNVVDEVEEETIVVSVPDDDHNINSYVVWG